MNRILSGLLLASTYASRAHATYNLQADYTGAKFFDGFEFFTDADPTGGTVTFLDEAAANDTGLAGFIETANNTMAVYMAADTTTSGGSGRGSVRVSSIKTFQHGLFIVDILHIPTGCGTWPAFWMVGGSWPMNGEIDIVEGVHLSVQNSMTLHTSPGFSNDASKTDFSGDLQRTDCGADAAALGCSITDNSNITFGSGFNDNLGGVYATEWTSDFIKIWFFPRGAIPIDATSANPDPTGWGTPTSLFMSNSSSSIDDHFNNLNLIFDLTFCGQWAGAPDVWAASTCGTLADTCADYVLNTPSAFTEAYWAVNTLQVFTDNSNSGSNTTTVPAKLKRDKRSQSHMWPSTIRF